MDAENLEKTTKSNNRNSCRTKILKTIGWSAWLTMSYFAISFLLILVLWGINFFVPNFFREVSQSVIFNSVLQAAVYVLVLIAAIGIPYFLAKKKGGANFADFKKTLGVAKPPKPGDILAVFLYLMYFYGAMILVTIILSLLIPQETLQQAQPTQFSETTNYAVWELILIAISLALIPALAEEILFRGFLFDKIRKFLQFWPTAIVVSLVFALWHFQFNVGVMTFILSLFACYFREKTGVIWSGIFLHFLVNFVAFSVRFLV